MHVVCEFVEDEDCVDPPLLFKSGREAAGVRAGEKESEQQSLQSPVQHLLPPLYSDSRS